MMGNIGSVTSIVEEYSPTFVVFVPSWLLAKAVAVCKSTLPFGFTLLQVDQLLQLWHHGQWFHLPCSIDFEFLLEEGGHN